MKHTRISVEVPSLHKMFFSKTSLYLYALTVICYLPFIFSFIWGNHDWGWIKEYTPLLSGLFEGRFSQFIVPVVLFEGNILPILTILLSLAFYSATAIIFTNLLNKKLSNTNILIAGLLLTTAPYTISWLYFNFILLSCLSWTFFVVISFYILNKHPHAIKNLILATTIFTLSLGGYPPVINMICAIFFILIINDLCFNNYTLKDLIKKYIPYAISIILAVILTLCIQYLLKKYNLQFNTYNTAQINLHTLLSKIILCLKSSFTQFIKTTSFINATYKILSLILCLIALPLLLKKSTHSFVLIILLIALLSASVISLLVAENSIYILNQPRIEFFGILYIYIFSFIIIQKSSSQLCKNTSYILSLCIILYNINTISYSNKVWLCGFNAENKLMERIITRIENNPQFDINNQYTFIQGGNLDFRSKYYISTNEPTDSYTLTAPYIPWHLPSKAYTFYQLSNFVQNDFDTYWSFINKHKIKTTPELLDYLTLTSKVWPQKNAIYIDNKTIILTLTKDGKNRATQWAQTNL